MKPSVLTNPWRSASCSRPLAQVNRRRLRISSRLFTVAQPAKGFTLLELMATVVIVAVLAAVALPNFSQATTRAKAVEAKQGIHTRLLQAHATLNSGDITRAELLATRIGSPDPQATLEASQEVKFTYNGILRGSVYRVEAKALASSGVAGKTLVGCIDLDNGGIEMQSGFDTPIPACNPGTDPLASAG